MIQDCPCYLVTMIQSFFLALILFILLEAPDASVMEFPITQNKEVEKVLKRLRSSSGKRHLKICFERMKRYDALISKKLKKYGLPDELKAIPVVESCYQNIHSKEGWGSGIWMFIKSTGRNYGLKINKKVDQRLNVDLATDAALRYLKANYKMFKDWELALLAYNVGENRVKMAIKKTKSRNAWTLVRKGYEGDKEYLAKVMAVVIILQKKTPP